MSIGLYTVENLFVVNKSWLMMIKLSVSKSNEPALYLVGLCPNLNFEIRNKPECIRSKPITEKYLNLPSLSLVQAMLTYSL